MKRVVIESPLSGDRERNKFYARLCSLDCLRRGEPEAPYASHLFFDHEDLLDDTKSEERVLGMTAGFAWGDVADYVAVYHDLGFSGGMRAGFARAVDADKEITFRRLPDDLWARFVERYPDAVRSTVPFTTGWFKMKKEKADRG